ncbi:MAG: M23 family metallopeptidase [Bacteroidales bacterium]|nr:M23 family metallopeptidase [Bacteroidales bacterium]
MRIFVVLKLTDIIKKSGTQRDTGSARPAARRMHRTRRRYRVEIINENTLGRIWSLRLSGVRVVVAALAVVAAIASLITVIFMFTPVRRLLPGYLPADERGRYLEMALKVDSLAHITREQDAYTRNIADILSGNTDETRPDAPATDSLGRTAISVDSIFEASEAERRFVRQFEDAERFNLSVLSPIAAEGMIFEAPSSAPASSGAVSAVYRGTVIASNTGADGLTTITIQHPNDFISVYGNLDDTFVKKGDKVVASQRLGVSTTARPLLFELWHGGSQLDPELYVAY